jgi:serine/threonine-protein kinase
MSSTDESLSGQPTVAQEPEPATPGPAPSPAAAAPGPTAPRELPEGFPIGEYRIEGRLGRGAFGTVYAAVQPLIGKRVAIKVLEAPHSVDPRMVGRFLAEARAVNLIRHEAIVDIFSFGELPDGRPCFVMERLDGRPLSALLKERGPLPLGEALAILEPVARAVEAAHQAGVTHRDLKPDNIFLCDAPGGGVRPKLLDFGVAKLVDEASSVTATATGVTVGTPAYMSPEQCVGKGVDPRSDIYSFGVLVHRVLAGRLPFLADSASEMMERHIYEKPIPLEEMRPDLPQAVTRTILWMLEKDRTRRPQSMAEALAALQRAADGEPQSPAALKATSELGAQEVETRDLRAPASPPRRRRALALLVAAVAIAAFAMVAAKRFGTRASTATSAASGVERPGR